MLSICLLGGEWINTGYLYSENLYTVVKKSELNIYVGHKRSLFLMWQNIIYVECGKVRNNKIGFPTVNFIDHLQVVAVWWWWKGTKDHEHPWKRFTALFYFAK